MDTKVARRSVLISDSNNNATLDSTVAPHALPANEDGEEYSVNIRSLMGVFQASKPTKTAAGRRALSATEQRKNIGASSHISPELRRKSVPSSSFNYGHKATQDDLGRRPKDKQAPHRRSTSDLSFNDHDSLAAVLNLDDVEDYFDKTSFRERFYFTRAKFKKIDQQLENASTASTHKVVVEHVQLKRELTTSDKVPPVKVGSTVIGVEETVPITNKIVSSTTSSAISNFSHETEFTEEKKLVVEKEETFPSVKATALQFGALLSTTTAGQSTGAKVQSSSSSSSRSASLPRYVRFGGTGGDNVSASSSTHIAAEKGRGATSTGDKSKRVSFSATPALAHNAGISSTTKKSATAENEEFVASDVRERLKVKKYGRFASEGDIAIPSAAIGSEMSTSIQQPAVEVSDIPLTTSATENVTTSPLLIMKKDSSSVAALPLTDTHLLLDEVARKHLDHTEQSETTDTQTPQIKKPDDIDNELSVHVAIAIESFSPFGKASSGSKKSQYRHSVYDEKLDDAVKESNDSTKKLERKASMEEIDAALKTADSYWQNKHGPSSAPLIFDSVSKSLKPDTSAESLTNHASTQDTPDGVDNTVNSALEGKELHMLPDGKFYYEIPGLPELADDGPPKKFNTIKFSTQPMKVYLTHAADEYDRRNDDVNPVAASAEYELEKRMEKMDQFTIEIETGTNELGIGIIAIGVGADTGLGKLGIFVKTLAPRGAAALDGRMRVCDQIIEVDGKSLVGVTHAYAASIIRNSLGRVKFLLGRDKDAESSDVVRIIQQSLEQERVQERMKADLSQRPSPGDIASSLERLAALRKLTGQYVKDNVDGEQSNGQDSSDGSTSSDNESTASDEPEKREADSKVITTQLKEVQHKTAVAEAEVTRLNAKASLLETAASEHQTSEKLQTKLDTNEEKLKSLTKEIAAKKESIEQSSHKLEQIDQLENSNATLEKKYERVQKTVEQLQQKENLTLNEYKSTRQQWAERDAHYTQEITSLNDQVAKLQRALSDADDKLEVPVTTLPPPVDWPASLEQPLLVDKALILSVELTGSSPDLSINGDADSVDGLRTVQLVTSANEGVTLRTKTPHSTTVNLPDNVPESYAMLMAATAKHVVNDEEKRGSSSDSDTPSQRLSVELSTKESATELANLLGEKAFADPELGPVLTPSDDAPPSYAPPPPPQDDRSRSCSTVTNPDQFERLQSTVDTTVSGVAKDIGVGGEDDAAVSIDNIYVNVVNVNDNVYVNVSKEGDDPAVVVQVTTTVTDTNVAPLSANTNVAPAASAVTQGSIDEVVIRRDNTPLVLVEAASKPSKDKGSSSKTSYDPNKPPKGKSDIPLSVDDSSKGKGSRVHLISSHSIDNGYGDPRAAASGAGPSPGSRQAAASSVRHRHSSSSSDEIDEHLGQVPVQPVSPSVAVRNSPYQEVQVELWTPQHVVQWLRSFGLDSIAVYCARADITGDQLLHLDSTRMKSVGMNNNKERDILKKKIKELKQSEEKRKKQLAKEKKSREKLAKQSASKKGKKYSI